MKIAIIRGENLNKFEMQSYEPLVSRYDITAYTTYNHRYDVETITFPVKKLHCLEEFTDYLPSPFKGGLNQMLHRPAYNSYMIGLEKELVDKDIAHVAETFNRYSYQAIKAKVKYGVKVVVTVWENIPFRPITRLPGVLDNNKIRSEVRDKADAFIAVSRRAKEALILEGVDEKKIHIIPVGVDINRFHPRKKDESLLSTLELQKETFIVLFVGRLVRAKGIFNLIYAAKLIDMDSRLNASQIRFLLVGGGPEKEKLKGMIERFNLTGNVHLLGQFSYQEIHKLYNIADVFILPSIPTERWQEQFGMVLVEAMASGCPVISTLSGSIPEVVGDAGILLQPDDYLALYEAIKELIINRELSRELGERARRRTKERFNPRKIAKQLDKLYSSILCSKR